MAEEILTAPPWPRSRPGAAGRTVAWLAKVVERALAEVDLSLPQYRVLGVLAEGTEVASVLAERLAVRRPSVTAIVDGLVGRGLVGRSAVAGDRRRAALFLTPRGATLLEQAHGAVDRRLAGLLDALPEPDAARAAAGLELWGQALASAHRGRAALR